MSRRDSSEHSFGFATSNSLTKDVYKYIMSLKDTSNRRTNLVQYNHASDVWPVLSKTILSVLVIGRFGLRGPGPKRAGQAASHMLYSRDNWYCELSWDLLDIRSVFVLGCLQDLGRCCYQTLECFNIIVKLFSYIFKRISRERSLTCRTSISWLFEMIPVHCESQRRRRFDRDHHPDLINISSIFITPAMKVFSRISANLIAGNVKASTHIHRGLITPPSNVQVMRDFEWMGKQRQDHSQLCFPSQYVKLTGFSKCQS